jgi:hypothetical protein
MVPAGANLYRFVFRLFCSLLDVGDLPESRNVPTEIVSRATRKIRIGH